MEICEENVVQQRTLFFLLSTLLLFSLSWASPKSGAAIPNTKGPFLRHNQSKIVWFDGYWWGVFFNTSYSNWYIFKFDGNTWSTVRSIDEFTSQRTPDLVLDALNHKLYILFPIPERIYRYSYDGGSWNLDSGFPHDVPGASSGTKNEPPVLSRALDGDLFVFSVHDSALWMTYSQDDGVTWLSSAIKIRDMSKSSGLADAVSFEYNGDGYMGVMVSEDAHGDVFFLKLKDSDDPTNLSNWDEETLPDPPESDNHVCMVRDLDNNLYGIIKWGSISSSTPHFTLFKRSNSGSWSKVELYDHEPGNTTRPALTVNETTDELYVFATVNDRIGYAVLDKDNLQDVQSEDWITLIENGDDIFNDVNATYLQISASSGLLVTGLNVTQNQIWYRYLPLDFTPVDDVIITEVHSHSNVLASYVEIQNRGSSSVDLSDYTLAYYDDGANSPTSTKSLSGTLGPNEFAVLARDGSEFQSEYGFAPDFTRSGFKFDGGADGIALKKNGAIVDYFNNATGDMVTWPQNYLFERCCYPNDGSVLTFDYALKGSDQAGSPSGGSTVSASIRYVNRDQNWYYSGDTMQVTEEIDTDESSQDVKVVTSIVDSVGMVQNSTTRYLTINGNDNDAFVESLPIPASLSTGTYTLKVTVYDQGTGNYQDSQSQSFDVQKGDTWQLTFTITYGSTTMQRVIAGNTEATDDYDYRLDSTLTSPGTDFYVSLYIDSSPYYLYKDTRYWDSPYDTDIDWALKVVNTDGGAVTIQWDSTALPETGEFVLKGLDSDVDMRQSSKVIFSGDVDLTVEYREYLTFTYDFSESGWYMVSLPLETESNDLNTLFPNVVVAYEWDPATGVYVGTTTIVPGKGYWFAVSTPHTQQITGQPVSRKELSPQAGWNMIGSLFTHLDFANPNDNPDGSVLITYGYDVETESYYVTDSLEPGEGYWLAALQNCNLLLKQKTDFNAITTNSSSVLPLAFIGQFGSTPPPPPGGSTEIFTSANLPTTFQLEQNYPNPFNPTTTIRVHLPERSHISLVVFNAVGQQVYRLAEGDFAAGIHEFRWDGRNQNGQRVASGIYYYKLQTESFTAVRKMILMR